MAQKVLRIKRGGQKGHEGHRLTHRKTGSRVHAEFPEGLYTDICYDSSVKAFAFLLADEGNMSAGKIKTVLYEATGGRLNRKTKAHKHECLQAFLKLPE